MGRTTILYDDASRQTSRLQASAARVSQTYDDAGQLLGVSTSNALGTLVSRFTNTYDGAGRRTVVQAIDGSRTQPGLLPRRPTRPRVAHAGVLPVNATFTYDPAGNRTLLDDSGRRTTSTFDGANQLLLDVTPSGRTTHLYDDAGNQTTLNAPAATTFYLWDVKNRLTVVEPVAGPVSMSYDADGRRLLRQTPTQSRQFVFDFEKVLQEADGSGTTQEQYLSTEEQYGDLLCFRRWRNAPLRPGRSREYRRPAGARRHRAGQVGVPLLRAEHAHAGHGRQSLHLGGQAGLLRRPREWTVPHGCEGRPLLRPRLGPLHQPRPHRVRWRRLQPLPPRRQRPGELHRPLRTERPSAGCPLRLRPAASPGARRRPGCGDAPGQGGLRRPPTRKTISGLPPKRIGMRSSRSGPALRSWAATAGEAAAVIGPALADTWPLSLLAPVFEALGGLLAPIAATAKERVAALLLDFWQTILGFSPERASDRGDLEGGRAGILPDPGEGGPGGGEARPDHTGMVAIGFEGDLHGRDEGRRGGQPAYAGGAAGDGGRAR